jgi:hypothetical protein
MQLSGASKLIPIDALAGFWKRSFLLKLKKTSAAFADETLSPLGFAGNRFDGSGPRGQIYPVLFIPFPSLLKEAVRRGKLKGASL